MLYILRHQRLPKENPLLTPPLAIHVLFFLPIPMHTTHDKQHCPEAALISKKVQEIENNDPNKRSSSSSDSTNKPPILKKGSSHSVSTTTPPTGPPVVK